MTSAAHRSVDVETPLHPAEWSELYRETLRLDGQWRRTAALAAAVGGCAGVAVVFGAPARLIGIAALVLLAALTTVAAARWWALPPRRWRHLPDELRVARWSLSSRRICAAGAGGGRTSTGPAKHQHHPELGWDDVDLVVVTRRMLVVRLGGGLGTIGLPRRALTGRDERLVLGWADESGAYLVHRRASRQLPRDP